MKLVSKEEREAHSAFVASEGAKGLIYGAMASLGIFSYLRFSHAVRFRSFNTSIKTCILTMPTIALSAFWADQGSVEFDRRMYSSRSDERDVIEEYREWKAKPAFLKLLSTVEDHKYQALLAVWGGSLFAAWELSGRKKAVDGVLKTAQLKRFVLGSSAAALVVCGALLATGKEQRTGSNAPVAVGAVSDDKEAERRRIAEEIRAAQEELAALRRKAAGGK